jgi:hypothetical protein
VYLLFGKGGFLQQFGKKIPNIQCELFSARQAANNKRGFHHNTKRIILS